MVFVLPFCLDVEVDGSAVGEALEEVQEHLRRHLAHLLATELSIPDEPGTTSEIQRHLAQAVVHRKAIAVALYAPLVAESRLDTFAQSESHIFYCVVLIHVQIALAADVEVDHPMLGNLFQHMVEEAKAGLYVALTVAVQADAHLNVCLLCGTLYTCRSFTSKEQLGNLFPSHVRAQYEAAATEVLRKLGIRLSVANDEAAIQVVFTCHIVGQHSCARLACRQVVLGEAAVDVDGIEGDALAFQYVEHEVLCGPEGVFGIAVCAKPVLIAHHHKKEVGVLTQETKGTDGSGHEAELLEAIYLFVSRLTKDSAVAVDEKNSIH